MENQSPAQNAIRWGLIWGVVGIIITLLIYIVDITMMVNMWFGLTMFALSIAFIIYAGISYRKSVGNHIKFGKAWIHSFVTLVVAGILGTIFNLILFGFIDPDASTTLIDAQVEGAVSMAESFGATGEALDQIEADNRERAENQWSTVGAFTQFGYGLIFYAIFSLISGAIVKKKDPAEDVGDVM